MSQSLKHYLLLSLLFFIVACTKNLTDTTSEEKLQISNVNDLIISDTSTILKDVAPFPIGTAISYNSMMNDANYAFIAHRDFYGVTFEYEMKHRAIVQNDGSLNFTKADALVNRVGNMVIFGHTLGWHENQNAEYLKNYVLFAPSNIELLNNPSFEQDMSNWSVYNSGIPSGNASINITSNTSKIKSGIKALKVVNPTGYPTDQWRVQISSSNFTTIRGRTYQISYWAKSANANGSIRLSTGPSQAQYQPDQTICTNWQKITWTITASLSSTSILFDMGKVASTYYIDDVNVREIVNDNSTAQTNSKADSALKYWISNMIGHYKYRVGQWDVINELITENGQIRNNTNTSITNNDVFIWSNYMGWNYPLQAFKYAQLADPTALLFINDFNLESNPVKLDSLIAIVKRLRLQGAKIDGIGTQMHITCNTPITGINEMFKKLAATGLQIRVSELDIKTSPCTYYDKFRDRASEPSSQAQMYRKVAQSYINNIPPGQRAGITIWGIVDKYSWLYNNGTEYPLLYSDDYDKKDSYFEFLNVLKAYNSFL